MNITLSSTSSGTVTSDGTCGFDTDWFFTATVWYDTRDGSHTADFHGTDPLDPETIPANMVGTATWPTTNLSGIKSIAEGGHTAHADIQVTVLQFSSPGLPFYVDDDGNFSIVSP